MSRLLGHLVHPPPAPPISYDPLPDEAKGALYATLSIVCVILLVVLGIAGCMTRLLCALKESDPPEEKEALKGEEEMAMRETPSQAQGTSSTAAPTDVDVSPTGDMPTISKVGHVLAILVAGVIALCVSSVLADGKSVIILKPPYELPIVTNPNLESKGYHHKLDELLGPSYGIGLLYDQSGHTWTQAVAGKTLKQLEADLGLTVIAAALPNVIQTDDLKHPVPFLQCKKLQAAGLTALAFGIIAEIVAVLLVLLHALALAGLVPSSKAKPLAALIWFVLSTGFVIVVCLALGIMFERWKCDNTIIPEIKLSEHFRFNYGFGFAVVGFVCSTLILNVTCFFTASKPDAKYSSVKVVLAKVVGGLVVGMVLGTVLSLVTLAGVGYFKDNPYVDPKINPCADQKPYHASGGSISTTFGDNYFKNQDCVKDNIVQTLEQAGANVTRGYKGLLDAADRVPITSRYSETDLCPVNVHWHLGAEHLSAKEYDYGGRGPPTLVKGHVTQYRRELGADDQKLGLQCYHYDATDAKFTTEFNWEHCTNMQVGQTYEIHWPHSAAGMCGTKWQYQTPFYDGVFCQEGIITVAPLNTYEKIGVQAQIFTVVNDEKYYYPDLFKGMRVDAQRGFGQDMAMYTGSTTGQTRSDTTCSRYTPVTWQVDRKCHMISASSFDKLCSDMKLNSVNGGDSLAKDLYPHGSRKPAADHLTANNQRSGSHRD